VPALTAPQDPDDPTDITTDVFNQDTTTDTITDITTDTTTNRPDDGTSVGDGAGSNITSLPAAPPLTQEVVPLPLYEARRVGGKGLGFRVQGLGCRV
jgi:hypothetical protein